MFTKKDLLSFKTREDVIKTAKKRKIKKLSNHLWNVEYEKQLRALQAELVSLQQWAANNNKRVAVIF